MADMAMDEGTTRFARRGPRGVRSAVAVGVEGKARRSKAPVSDCRCLMCSEGVVYCSGYDNQVAREGRGMCLAKQAADNETSDGWRQRCVSDMEGGQREEVDSEARPSP
jgi:hypothetical protein